MAKGAVYALLGRNGAGKSSTIQCLVGQRKAASGECRIFGIDTWRRRRHVMARTSVVPETPDLPPGASAIELGRFLGRIRPVWNAADYQARLERVGVPLKTPSQQLSKGQRRQLALAAALAAEPDVLILDDPTLGLDAVVRRTLLEELVGELADRGTTVFGHNPRSRGDRGDRRPGGDHAPRETRYDEAMDELKKRFRRLRFIRAEVMEVDEVRAALDPLDVADCRFVGAAVDAVVGLADHARVSAFMEAVGLTDLEIEPLSLEEIFVALCGDENGG